MDKPQQQFKVERAQAEGFAKVWKTPGGIHLAMTPASLQFATDFANVVLRGFIEMCQLQTQAAKTVAEQVKPEPPKIELVEA